MLFKLCNIEMICCINEFVIILMGLEGGYYVGDLNVVDDGVWICGYLNFFFVMIGGGIL